MIQTRLIIATVLLAFGGFLVWFIPHHYREQGRQEVIQKYEEASKLALKQRELEIESLKVQHEATNKIITADYEARLSALDVKYRAAQSIGLRLPKTACERSSATAETTSTSGSNETESVRLPARIENGLFDIARKADETREQLNACQAWIKSNGFATDENRTK